MDLLLKSGDKSKAKKYLPKFQSILMQVAKSGVVNKKTAARKVSKLSKKLNKVKLLVDKKKNFLHLVFSFKNQNVVF